MRRQEAVTFYVMILPWVVGFVVFIAYPMARSFYLAFTRYNLRSAPQWVGFDNFTQMFTKDPLFWQSFKVTLLYVLGSVPAGTLFALLVAMILAQALRGVNFWRTIYFMPTMVSGVAIAVMWTYLLNPQYGLVNQLLEMIGVRGPGWIASTTWALPSLILMSWWSIGGQMVIYLAGLKGIPQSLYEAAEIDGAGEWAKFRHVTVPMLTPTIFFNLVLGLIGAFQVFEGPLVLTAGGPNNATLTYVLNLYNQAFRFIHFGYASAMAWFLFAVIMALTLLVIRSSALWVYYETGGKE
ncbi:MAG: sugar ABC transporter permease [Anaerolineae bacterium]|nr:sugar ABC transporter permease [Anaerolineae bacterium]